MLIGSKESHMYFGGIIKPMYSIIAIQANNTMTEYIFVIDFAG